MIRFNSGEDYCSIYGINNGRFSWIITGLIYLFFLIVASALIEIRFHINYENIIFVVLSILLILGTKVSLRFYLKITLKTILVRKTLFGIPYSRVKKEFETISYLKEPRTLKFEKGSKSICVENFEGFEVDCLLITTDKKEYEIGNKRDAKIIFDYLNKSIEKLEIKKSH